MHLKAVGKGDQNAIRNIGKIIYDRYSVLTH